MYINTYIYMHIYIATARKNCIYVYKTTSSKIHSVNGHTHKKKTWMKHAINPYKTTLDFKSQNIICKNSAI